MEDSFIRDRITQLRIRKGVSEYRMSYELGHSRGYIYNISSGKALPPMKEFLAICDYLDVSPRDFFDEEASEPALIRKALKEMRELDDEDMLLLLRIIHRLRTKGSAQI